MLFVWYPKCSTCMKAKKWLEEKGVEYEIRDIRENNPSSEELREWYAKSGLPLKRFFNTSGNLYKELKLKDRLVKRPVLVDGDMVLVGFKEKEWDEKIRP